MRRLAVEGVGIRHGRREWATTSSSEPVVTGTHPPILYGFEEFVFSFLDLLGKIDGVVSVPQFAQLFRPFFRKVRVLQESFARGQAWAVDLANFRTDALLAQHLEARDEEIPEQFVRLVEPLHGFFQLGAVESIVAQWVPDVSGVLLLDVGIVVLLAGPGARKLDGILGLAYCRVLISGCHFSGLLSPGLYLPQGDPSSPPAGGRGTKNSQAARWCISSGVLYFNA